MDQLWSNKTSGLLCEGPEPKISMISIFPWFGESCSLIWIYQHITKQMAKFSKHTVLMNLRIWKLENVGNSVYRCVSLLFHNIGNLNFYQFRKRWAPVDDEHPLNIVPEILDAMSRSIENMNWEMCKFLKNIKPQHHKIIKLLNIKQDNHTTRKKRKITQP